MILTGLNVTVMVTVMIYIRVTGRDDAKVFIALAKSGFPVVCLPENTYGVGHEHLKILRRRKISFKKLTPGRVPVPQSALAV